jgi:hypothetical protein
VRILLAAATAVTILAIALLLLLTPLWTHFALRSSGADVPGRLVFATVAAASDATIADLLFFGDFDVRTVSDAPLYTDDERAHLRDARLVLFAFLAIAAVALVFLVLTVARAPTDPAVWRSIATGGSALAVTLIVLGLIALIAFDALFEIFHRVLFPGGNWAFPADSNLIRLDPFGFWQLTSAALVGLATLGGMATWWFARRRAARLAA